MFMRLFRGRRANRLRTQTDALERTLCEERALYEEREELLTQAAEARRLHRPVADIQWEINHISRALVEISADLRRGLV